VILTLSSGTLTKNEQTVTEIYSVDDVITIDPASSVPSGMPSPAHKKAMEIGVICNNASAQRREDGKFAGQSTDVALLDVLDVFGIPDIRPVRSLPQHVHG
jgi:P-type Ca2+ transporter type 2C